LAQNEPPLDANTADEAAIGWFVRLRDEEATAADRKAFAAWLASDDAHREAWNEIERVWGRLGEIAPEGLAAQTPPAPAIARREPRRSWARIAAAAVILIAAFAGWRLAPPGLLADHRTGVAERRMVALADGSQVELGPQSALDVGFEAGRRHVRLIAGNAYFEVAPDARRPFTVEAGPGRIAVLGTAFDVKITEGDAVSVAVTHNAVSVSTATGAAVRLREGQAVSYDRDGVSDVQPADLDAVLGWRHGQLVFHDAPLDEVFAEIGRYRRGHVQLLGAGLGSRRITAVFDARQPEAAIETIARSLDLRVLRATGLLIALSPW
jgi:transmembrane sensor